MKDIHPEAKLGWVMTWAYAQDFDGSGFQNYQNDQAVMYYSIRNAVRQMLADYPEIEFVVPCGTAVQNLRSSFLGDRVNRDGTHLNTFIGRYLTAYTFFATMFGEETAIGNSYMPYYMNDFTMRVIRGAALDAVRNPFAVTPQVYPDYVGDNSIVPNDIKINFTAERNDAYWDKARPFMMDVISEGGMIDSKYGLFAEAGDTNDLIYDTYPYPKNPNVAPRSTAEDVEMLRTFLLGHINWLDEKFQTIRTLVEAMNLECAYPCDPDELMTDIEIPASDASSTGHPSACKVIRDGHLYIIKDGNTYSPDGKKIK